MQITDTIREKLSPYLAKGWGVTVAERAGVHRNTVTNVFNGYSQNEYVAKAIIAYAEEVKARQQELEERAGAIDNNHDAKVPPQDDANNA